MIVITLLLAVGLGCPTQVSDELDLISQPIECFR